jgi:hypothetical protein
LRQRGDDSALPFFSSSHFGETLMIYPVHLPEKNEDGSYQNGLSYDDYSRGQRKEHKLFESRSSTPPSWAVNLKEMSFLLARYFELRALISRPRIDTPERRIIYAQNRILSRIPSWIATLDKLVAELAASADPERRRVLESRIRTIDTQICVDQRGPALICGIIFYFFRCGYDSGETAAAIKHVISREGIRQIAHRLEKLWQKMQSGNDKKPKPEEVRRARVRMYYRCKYKPVQIAKEKAARDAETPEQREARLAWHREYYYKNKARIRAQQKIKRTPDRVKAMNEARRWRETPEARRARHQKEYAANPAKNRERVKLTPRAKSAALRIQPEVESGAP